MAYLKKQAEKVAKKKLEDQEVAEAYKKTVERRGPAMVPPGDVHRLDSQNFFVYSYCTPNGETRVKSVKDLAMKFSCAFRTFDEANAHAQIIRDEDPRFDVQVAEMYEWGSVPLSDEQRPFVKSVYANEILTRAMSGLQRSMIRGKKDMDARKTREMEAAQKAMQKVKGKDYVMPEKSKALLELEERIEKEREAKEAALVEKPAAADAVVGSDAVKFSLLEISDLITEFCKIHNGETIDIDMASLITKHISRRSLELEALIRHARAAEFADEDPRNVPI